MVAWRFNMNTIELGAKASLLSEIAALAACGGLLDSLQAAALLGIDDKTLQRMARRKEIPAIKVGRLWRFRKPDLDSWMETRVIFDHHPCRQ
jgi:excisionase family DNA binding protein